MGNSRPQTAKENNGIELNEKKKKKKKKKSCGRPRYSDEENNASNDQEMTGGSGMENRKNWRNN